MHSRLKLDISWAALFRALLAPPLTSRGRAAAHASLAAAFAPRSIVVGLSVRTLFDAILTELAPPPGAPVVMSAITIQNMADIVRAHGLTPEAVDIDCQSLAPQPGDYADRLAATGARICVATQLFGAVAPLEPTNHNQAFLIEDAAQAFAGPFHLGSPAADVTLFSFGPIKRRTALGGGIAVFRDPALALRIAARLDQLPQKSDAWFRRRAAKYLLLKALTAPLPYRLVVALITLSGRDPDAVIGGAARGFSGASLIEAIRARPPDRMIALLARQVTRAPAPAERQGICTAFTERIPAHMRVAPHATPHAYWLFPIVTSEPAALIAHLRRHGFDATRGATSLRAIVPEHTPAAERLMSTIVYLPHPASLRAGARNRLAELITQYSTRPNQPADAT